MNMRYLYFLTIFLSSYVVAQNRDVHNRGEIHVKPNTLVSVKSAFVNESSGNFINDGEVIFSSHTTNDGKWSFTDGLMGYTRFESNNLQRIDGSRSSRFFDILFNNPTHTKAFELFNKIEAHGEVMFLDGIIYTRTTGGDFFFYEDAFSVGTSDHSHIDGFVHKIGNEDFEYPIGHEGFYRPLIKFGSSGIDDTYGSVYHFENSDIYFPHDFREREELKINTSEYWEFHDFVTSDHVYVTLSLDERTKDEEFMDEDNDPTIVAWNAETEQWEDLGGAINVEEKTITTIIKTDIYGAYTLAIIVDDGKEVVDGDFEIFNGVNPNDTGGNEYFRIEGLEKYPDNELVIFNRWGVEVYQTTGYGSKGNVFRGLSDGRVTIRKNQELPEGSYFYVLKRIDPNTGKRITDTGYLYLTR